MARETYIFRDGGAVQKHLYNHENTCEARSDLPAPMLIRDQMDALRHPVTGQYMDSKSSFERATKDAGCICVGNEAPVTAGPPKLADVTEAEIGAAYQKVNAGYKPALRDYSENLADTSP